MPAERVSMRRVREILRLKYEAGASDRAIARSVGVARSTVWLCLGRATAAGLTWPLPETLSEAALEALLFAGGGAAPGVRHKAEPDWAVVHLELRRPGVTLMLLWDEYRQANPDGYQYSRWCELYRAWEGRLSPTMGDAQGAGLAGVEHHGGGVLPDGVRGGHGAIWPPGTSNTDQGRRFISPRFTGLLQAAGLRVSMDGRGRWMDNVFIERLWRSLKNECVHLHAFETGSELRAGLANWIGYYNGRRPHSALAGRTPEKAYEAPTTEKLAAWQQPGPSLARPSDCPSKGDHLRKSGPSDS